MYRCTTCGKDNQDAYKFCLGCGATASAPTREPEPTPYRSAGEPGPGGLHCAYCGVANQPQYKFCRGCAQPLQAAQAPAVNATTFRDFAPRLAYALYVAHQQLTTRPDHFAHVAIIAGTILAAARAIQSRVVPHQGVIGEAATLAIRDGGFAREDPLVVAFGQVSDFFRHYGEPMYPRDDAGLTVAAGDPDLAGRAQALADVLRAR